MVKRFGKVTALSRITLNLCKGEVNIITGPNGAGKSTLLKCMDGLYRPDSGSVLVDGMNPYHDSAARGRMALLTDNYALYDNMTVAQNMLFFGKLYKIGKREINNKLPHLLDGFGAKQFLGSKVYTLSRGTKQKVALCRALLCDPDILLLDEPTAFLDPNASEYIRGLIARMSAEGKTIVMATQKADEIPRFNARLIFIKNGRIAKDTTTYAFYRSMAEGAIAEIRLASPIGGALAKATPGFSSGNSANPTLLKVKVRSYKSINRSISYLSAHGAYIVGVDYTESIVKKFA